MPIELAFRRILFFLLLSVAPAFVFLGQAMIFEPPAAILSSVLSQLWRIAVHGESESLFFAIFFLAHFALFAVLYWMAAFTVAKLIWLMKYRPVAMALCSLSLLGIVAITQLRIYGAGGHGATRVARLQDFIGNEQLVGGGFHVVYLATIVLIGVALASWAGFKSRASDAGLSGE